MSRLRIMLAVCGDILCFRPCLFQSLCIPQSDSYSGRICVAWSWEFFKKYLFVTETVPNSSLRSSVFDALMFYLCGESRTALGNMAQRCIRNQEEWQPHQYSAAISKQEPVLPFFFFLLLFNHFLPSRSHHLNFNRMWWVEVALQSSMFSVS